MGRQHTYIYYCCCCTRNNIENDNNTCCCCCRQATTTPNTTAVRRQQRYRYIYIYIHHGYSIYLIYTTTAARLHYLYIWYDAKGVKSTGTLQNERMYRVSLSVKSDGCLFARLCCSQSHRHNNQHNQPQTDTQNSEKRKRKQSPPPPTSIYLLSGRYCCCLWIDRRLAVVPFGCLWSCFYCCAGVVFWNEWKQIIANRPMYYRL